MQIFNIINARRPSVHDFNPLAGISWFTLVSLKLMLCFQFFICYVPEAFGYTTIDVYTNLACLGIGAGSVAWFIASKLLIHMALLSRSDSLGSDY